MSEKTPEQRAMEDAQLDMKGVTTSTTMGTPVVKYRPTSWSFRFIDSDLAHREQVYHDPIDILLFIGNRGRILGYRMCTEYLPKFGVNVPIKGEAPAGTLATLRLNGVQSEVRTLEESVKIDGNTKDEFGKDGFSKRSTTMFVGGVPPTPAIGSKVSLKEYRILCYTKSLEERILEKIVESPPETCPMRSYKEGDVDCETCQFCEPCNESAAEKYKLRERIQEASIMEAYNDWGYM